MCRMLSHSADKVFTPWYRVATIIQPFPHSVQIPPQNISTVVHHAAPFRIPEHTKIVNTAASSRLRRRPDQQSKDKAKY